MDYKKVGNIEFDGKQYSAELNDATFNGNVSALTGTFDGSLTVGSLDNVRNITIGGNQVAQSSYVYTSRSPSSGYVPEGSHYTMLTDTFYTEFGGFGIINIEMYVRNGDNDTSQLSFYGYDYVQVNGVTKYQTENYSLGLYYFNPSIKTISILVSLSAGTNTIALKHYTNSAPTTPMQYYQNVKLGIMRFNK